MNRHKHNDALLGFANSYLREAFPNPLRTGCTADELLLNLAQNPTIADPSVTEHIAICSPCFARYMQLLEEQKGRTWQRFLAASRGHRVSTRKRSLGLTVALLLFVSTGVLLLISRISPRTGGRSDSEFLVDLTGVSAVRGDEREAPNPEIQLARRSLSLAIRLPLGSEEGTYRISMRSASTVLWSQSAQAHLTDHAMRLNARVDLGRLPPGEYVLTVESVNGVRFSQPVKIVEPAAPAGKSSHSSLRNRIVASLISTLASVQLPSATRYQSVSGDTDFRNAGQLIAEADHLAWLGNWPAAGPLYASAEILATAAGDLKQTSHARIGRIRSQAQSMPFAQASSLLADELRSPIVQNDPKLRLFCLTAKGYTDIDVNLESSRTAWEQARETAQELREPLWESRASAELGIIAFLDGDSSKAERLVGSALIFAMANGDSAAQVRYLSMIGNGLIELNRYEEALEYFTRALKLASRTKDIGFPFMAYEGESRCLVALNRFQEADKLLRAGLEASQKLQRRGHEAQILVLLGKLSLATNNVIQATSYLRAANDLSRSAQFYPTEVEATFQLAAIYRAQGKVWETEQCLQLGIAASRALGDKYYLPRDLSSLAEIEMSRGRFRNADALWEQSTEVLEGMLINAPSPDARSTMIAAMSDVYLRHFLLAVRKHEVEKAFQIVERVRGRSIVDLLWHRSLDRSRLNVDMNAAQHISTLQIQLMHAVSRNQRQGLLDQLFDAEQKWSFQESDQAQHYRVQRPIALRTLQRFLRKDEVLLEYVLADPRSYCVVVTRRHARLVSIGASREQIGVLVGEYLEEVKERRSANEAAQRLYSLLLDPISAVALRPRMVVVPDGVLHLLPFDALRVPNGNYLLQSSVVTYVPSATVLYFLRTSRKGTVPSLPFLGIGDVVYNADQRKELADSGGARQSRGRGLYDLVGATFRALPGTRDEVLAASQIFGPRSVVLLGAGATETAFKSQPLAKFGILHLAVHGIFSPKYPERSALVLGRDGNTGEDGLLQTREITNLVLNADLVTLSACDTGAGRLQGEEGIASLQRAFLFAGAKSTLAMLWNADDIFTAALIKQFYRNLAAGMDKGSALREAKMNLLATFGDRALPFYWAGAVLIGESSRPLLFLK